MASRAEDHDLSDEDALALQQGVLARACRDAGLLIRPDRPLQCSVLHHTAEDLFAARHTHEVPRRDPIYVSLDAAHRGVGGLSWLRDAEPRHRVGPGQYRLRFTLEPLAASSRR